MKIKFTKEYVAVDPATNSGIIHRFGEVEEIKDYTAQWLIDNGFAEEVKEPGGWKPKFNETYYFVDGSGKVDAEPWLNDELDEYRYSVGECFKTKKAAEAWRGYRIARATVSRDKGVLTPEQIRDNYLGEFVHYVVFNLDGQLEASWDCLDDYATPGTIYFDTMQHAQDSLDKHPDEWKIIANYDWSRE